MVATQFYDATAFAGGNAYFGGTQDNLLGVLLRRDNRDDLGDTLQSFIRRGRQRPERNHQLAFVTNPLVVSRDGTGEKVENSLKLPTRPPDVDLGHPERFSCDEGSGGGHFVGAGDGMAKTLRPFNQRTNFASLAWNE